jgi:hypothetical protein
MRWPKRLDDGERDSHKARDWHERAQRLGRLVDQPRSSIGWRRESMRGNHGGRGTGTASPPGKAYDDALALLDHVAVHIAGVTRTVLETANHNDSEARPGPQVTGPYAGFLCDTARAIGLYG